MAKLAIRGGRPLRERPFPRWPAWDEAERDALVRVLESSCWGGVPYPGAEALRFAAAFSEHLGVPECVLCASGSVGLEYALKAVGLRPGDEVIVPAFTFAATATAVAFAHGVPVFVDVDAERYCLDPDAVEEALTARTAGIVPVHLGCNMADMDRLLAIAARRGLFVIEDCAQAHGHRWRSRAAGSLGDIGVFSFEQSKLMSAGEGGALVMGRAEYAQRAHSLVNCGRKLPPYDGFEGRVLGRNARITEWQAAVLSCQLARLEHLTDVRERGAAQFERLLSGVPGLSFTRRDLRNTRRAVYRLIVKYDASLVGGVAREAFVAAVCAEGVRATAGFYPPAFAEEVFPQDASTNPLAALRLSFRANPARTPVACRAAAEEAVWIPGELFLGSEDDVTDAANAFLKVYENRHELA